MRCLSKIGNKAERKRTLILVCRPGWVNGTCANMRFQGSFHKKALSGVPEIDRSP